jgi:hypothetical protein
MFRSERKRFSALKTAVGKCRVDGCEIRYNPSGHIAIPYTTGRPEIPGNKWINVMGRFGIPCTTVNGNVQLVTGKIVETMTDDEIKEMLSGGVFLDGQAACCLYEKGWGEMIGTTEVVHGKVPKFCNEGLRHPDNYRNIQGQLMYNYIFASIEGGPIFELKPVEQAEIITDFLDIDEKPFIPGMMRYENKSGGRVAITALSLRDDRLLNYKKKELVRQTVEWLGKQALPVFVRNLPNVFCIFNRALSNQYAIVTVINLCSDSAESFSLDLADEWLGSTIELLNRDGQWQRVKHKPKNATMNIGIALHLMQPVILKLTKSTN